ncbi:hypothetical protein ABZS66_21080 [Dactylosporangium sp. NPDC005572]|uniref:hypothetical protein n=1 Tax=Dactylosporangium sp. NPDC005572 TaxID=3156889 RepID=UPI0033BAC155
MNTPRIARIAATAFAAGALWHIISCVRALVDPTEPGSVAFARSNNLGSVAHLLWLAGLLALAVVTWRTNRTLARAGYAIAALGLVLLATAELVIGRSYDLSQALFTLSVPVNAIGLTCLGLATARHNTGRTRYAVVTAGIYVFLVMVPVFAIFGAPNYPTLIGWGITWLLVAAATWSDANNLAGRGAPMPVRAAA